MCNAGGGVCTLRAAIMEANAASDSTITLERGTYVLSVKGNGEEAGSAGDLDITADVTIAGPAVGRAVILARGGWDDRIIEVHSGQVLLSNLIISGGNISGDSGDLAGNGGGISNNGALTLEQVTVSNNSALNGGGLDNDGSLTINESTIVSNTAIFDGGGGGGLLTSASFGGGNVTMTNSAVRGNHSALDGGGILNRSKVRLVNVTIADNTAEGRGGGIFNGDLGNTVDLNNVTVAGNTADADRDTFGDGGGIFAKGDGVTMRNTLLAENHDLSVTTRLADCAGTLHSQGFNLLGAPTGCTLDGAQGGNLVGVAPLLGPLTLSTSGLPFHPLLAGSPAIDAGNQAAPGSGDLACAAVDQLGTLRPRGARCDIGAFEAAFLADQTISFPPIADRTLGDAAFVLTATASSGLPVHFTSNTPQVCDVSTATSVLTLLTAGICNVNAEIDADANFNAATAEQSFAVRDPARQSQTISFGPLPSRLLGAEPFVLMATASSGLPVRFETRAFSVCQVDGADNTVTLIAPGTCILLALQDGNSNVNPAPVVERAFQVGTTAPNPTPEPTPGTARTVALPFILR